MVVKTIVMLSLFITPLVFINLGMVSSSLLLFSLYLISGLGMAGIGMGIMHDALHGSYSKNKKVNNILGYSINLIGANASIWKIQHNVLHHTYTNIDHADEDINVPLLLRLSPNQKRYKIHRFQHFYVWFLYGLMTLSWVTIKDFIQIGKFKKMGFFDKKNEFSIELTKAIVWKLIYYSFALVLPIIMAPMAWYIVVFAFLGMHFITGNIITIIFQTAHVMPGSEFPQPNEEGIIANNWTIHQLATTSNYSPKNKFFSWFVGGLNYQVEHHLFPNICHVHYRKLSRIVSETAKEYGIPYRIEKTFISAVWSHLMLLRQLGRMELVPVK